MYALSALIWVYDTHREWYAYAFFTFGAYILGAMILNFKQIATPSREPDL